MSIQLLVPDLGGFDNIPVIEILVQPGQVVQKNEPLVTLESSKATMEVPASHSGTVLRVLVQLNDRVSQGSPVVEMDEIHLPEEQPSRDIPPVATKSEPVQKPASLPIKPPALPANPFSVSVHASPTVRQFARELGVPLNEVISSGPNKRILKTDVQQFVKQLVQKNANGMAGFSLEPWPDIDFTQFGSIQKRTLTRIQKLTGAYLHRNWVRIPHVTYTDEVDVTDLEIHRQAYNERQPPGPKLTILSYLLKALVVALKVHQELNSSLVGDELILKQYYHFGFAVDTPQGLVVPVVRDVDQLSLSKLAEKVSQLAERARSGQISPQELQGGSFTVSSLGSIGGRFFTPIINAPEVAILGVGRIQIQPVWSEGAFIPRSMLPLSLSYDHRVVDGVLGARFMNVLKKELLLTLNQEWDIK